MLAESGCDPAPVDGNRCAGDRCRRITGEEDCQRGHFLDLDELLGWLALENDFLDDVSSRQIVRLRLIVNLLVNQWRFDEAGAYGITGNALLCRFQRNRQNATG